MAVAAHRCKIGSVTPPSAPFFEEKERNWLVHYCALESHTPVTHQNQVLVNRYFSVTSWEPFLARETEYNGL